MRNFFPAKVLLFGEHRVLRGARALAVPLAQKGAEWVQNVVTPDPRLLDFAAYLSTYFSKDHFNYVQLEADLSQGWQLASNVPFGYGLGSSGTVCAAVCYRYGTSTVHQLPPTELRSFLAKMEGHFHGQSSGTDPLISYQNRAALLQKEFIEWPELPADWAVHFFLLDTEIARTSGPLIEAFLNRYDQDAKWRAAVDEQWGVADEACIQSLMMADKERLRTAFAQLSQQQLLLAPNLIPASIQPIWSGSSYQLKLCGAGGGGFMLGCTLDREETLRELADWNLSFFE